MAREFMCQYGNCTETKITITVNDADGMEKPRFCCREHAGLYLLRRAWMYEGKRDKATAERIADGLAKELRN